MNFYTREEKQSRRVVNAGCQATAASHRGVKGFRDRHSQAPEATRPVTRKPRHTGAPEEGPEFPKKPSVCVGGSVG